MLLINADNAQDAPEYNRCAKLLVWSWRLIVTGRAGCPLIRWEFNDACRGDAEPVCSALCGFLCALARARRRRLMVNHPGHPAPTHDEIRMLILIAAAQDGNETLLDAHLRWIAKRGLQDLLEESARELATSLVANGLWLPLGLTRPPSPCGAATDACQAARKLECAGQSTH